MKEITNIKMHRRQANGYSYCEKCKKETRHHAEDENGQVLCVCDRCTYIEYRVTPTVLEI